MPGYPPEYDAGAGEQAEQDVRPVAVDEAAEYDRGHHDDDAAEHGGLAPESVAERAAQEAAQSEPHHHDRAKEATLALIVADQIQPAT